MRIAKAFAATALAAATVAGSAPAAFAVDPVAEVSPRTVAPSGTVTVSVSCPTAGGGAAPETMTANSQAFQQGSVQLRLVDNPQTPQIGPAYRGTARIAPESNFSSATSQWGVDGTCPGGQQWNATFTVSRATPTPTPSGVRGGVGGSITESPITAIAGGALVTTALGATYLVLRRKKASLHR